MKPRKIRPSRRRIIAGSVIAATLSAGGAGAAMATGASLNPWAVDDPGPAAETLASAAFWDAGYTALDLEALAELWQVDAAEAEVAAGTAILKGEMLPIAPNSTAVDEADPAAAADAAADTVRIMAFWDAGYTFEDLGVLTDLWQMEPIEAKAIAGQMILDGEALPIEPGSTPLADPEAYQEGQRYIAFWDAGYTFEDATVLAELWALDVNETKATAGQMILDGQALPIPPGGTPAAS